MPWRQTVWWLRVRVLFLRWFLVGLQVLILLVGIATLVWAFSARRSWPVAASIALVGTAVVAALVVLFMAGLDVVPYYYREEALRLDRLRAYGDRRPFFLYLRSFHDTVSATVTETVVPPENQGRTTYHYILNLSQILDRALSPFGRVLYLSNESTDVFGEYGLIVESTDETWRNVFQICAAQARAVLVAPGDTPGVVRGDAHAVRR